MTQASGVCAFHLAHTPVKHGVLCGLVVRTRIGCTSGRVADYGQEKGDAVGWPLVVRSREGEGRGGGVGEATMGEVENELGMPTECI